VNGNPFTGLPLDNTHTFFPSCTFFDQLRSLQFQTSFSSSKKKPHLLHTRCRQLSEGFGFFGDNLVRRKEGYHTIENAGTFHEELAFFLFLVVWLLPCLLSLPLCSSFYPTHLLFTECGGLAGWTCTYMHNKPSTTLATRSTTSVGTWNTLSVRCIANHSTWLCVVRNREGPFAVHIETYTPTLPSTCPHRPTIRTVHLHTHTPRTRPCRAVPCRAVTDSCILVRIVEGYLQVCAVFFLEDGMQGLNVSGCTTNQPQRVPCNTVCLVHLLPSALASL